LTPGLGEFNWFFFPFFPNFNGKYPCGFQAFSFFFTSSLHSFSAQTSSSFNFKGEGGGKEKKIKEKEKEGLELL
jgi:hypothetical protein